MKKSKTIFIIIFSIILSVMSISIISLYDNVKESAFNKNNYNLDGYEIDDMTLNFEVFILKMLQETDTDYQPFQYEILKEKELNYLQRDWNRFTGELEKEIYSDSYFAFSIKNTKTGMVKTNHLNLLKKNAQKSDYALYEHIKIDENGEMIKEGDLNYWFDDDLLTYIFGDWAIDDEDEIEIDTTQLKLNKPKSLDIIFAVPQKIGSKRGIISNAFYRVPRYTSFTYMVMLISIAVLGLFILLYPIRIVKEVNPFSTIKEWKFEFLFILFSSLISLGILGCFEMVDMTLNNNISNLLIKYQIPNSYLITMMMNFGVWMATLFMISCAFFMIKYILVYGLWKYIKEKTVISAIYRYIKNSLLKISDIDLTNSLNKTIMKYIAVNTGVIIVLISLGGFGCVLAIIYAFAAFFFIKKEINKIYDDYKKLLKLTNELSQGHFNEEINEDLGIFNHLKDEFNTIKTGFEKAVKEETKSQNMKTELISNVSHDLKTPITCIKNYVYLLKDENIDQDTRNQYIHNLEQYTNRLTSLIEDLFEVSKVNSGTIQLNQVNLNIIALLEQTIAESEEILNSKNLQVVKNYEDTDIQLFLDGDKTYRVFENLLTNIGKYAMSSSRVYIDVKNKDDVVVLEFKNMSENQMNFTADEIVERFVRGDKSRHETGSGLGLAIAKSFTEAQNGKFHISIDGDLFKVIIVFNK